MDAKVKSQTSRAKSRLRSEEGMATLETLPILVIFLVLAAYMFGSFGIIHTGILHSIAARNYAFETFRHRANLVYFRDNRGAGVMDHYAKDGVRFHAVVPEEFRDNDVFRPTQRSISMVMPTDAVNEKSTGVHENLSSGVRDGVRVTENFAVNPVWVKVQYGICIDAKCGD